MQFLNDIPLATVISVAAVIGGIVALINGSIDFEGFLVAIGFTTAGAGVLGHARNGAGHGVR